MRNRPHVAVRGRTRRGAALLVLAASALVAGVLGGPAEGAAIACAGALGLFAWSLPGAAPDGVLIGFGATLVSMIGWNHPAQRTWAALASAVLATVVILRVRAWKAGQRGYASLGAFWLSVPVAACAVPAAIAGRDDVLGRVAELAATVAVLLLVVAAARRRARDLSVGMVAGLLGAVAVLVALRADRVFEVASGGVRLADGRLVGWPADLLAFAAVAAAGRIGPDRGFPRWQRWTAVAGAAVLLVVAGSATGYASALVAGVAFAVFTARREIGVRGSLRLAWRDRGFRDDFGSRPASGSRPDLGSRLDSDSRVDAGLRRVSGSRRAIVAGTLPLVALVGLVTLAITVGGLRSDWSTLRDRAGLATLPGIGALSAQAATARGVRAAPPPDVIAAHHVLGSAPHENPGILALLFGHGIPIGLLAGAALLAGAVRVLWRVTGPGLPLWIPVVGLSSLVGILAAGSASSPAWLLVASAELWVVYRNLRTDRDTAPTARPMVHTTGHLYEMASLHPYP